MFLLLDGRNGKWDVFIVWEKMGELEIGQIWTDKKVLIKGK